MKIGVTEAGDAGLDLSWVSRLAGVDAAVVITKNLLADGFTNALVRNSDKCILHSTITGYGGSALEPNVPSAGNSLAALYSLVREEGFPLNQVVVRVDPIIPTEKGLRRAKRVMIAASNFGFMRFRVSVIDMYPHARERFIAAGLPLPYLDGFAPPAPMLAAVDEMLSEVLAVYPGISIESCAETLQNASSCGCISRVDLGILGIPSPLLDAPGHQRAGCKCASCKTELLEHKCQCPHGCLYCYWH